jgi:hypothetical protein
VHVVGAGERRRQPAPVAEAVAQAELEVDAFRFLLRDVEVGAAQTRLRVARRLAPKGSRGADGGVARGWGVAKVRAGKRIRIRELEADQRLADVPT